MTRINLIDPALLTDQHLFAEFREIKMIPKSLARSLRTKSINEIYRSIPAQFTLNAGHVKFFFDKGSYLRDRYERIKSELRSRGVNFDESSIFDPDGTMLVDPWNGWYNPSNRDIEVIKSRIKERIMEKPTWYRFRGVNLNETGDIQLKQEQQ